MYAANLVAFRKESIAVGCIFPDVFRGEIIFQFGRVMLKSKRVMDNDRGRTSRSISYNEIYCEQASAVISVTRRLENGDRERLPMLE